MPITKREFVIGLCSIVRAKNVPAMLAHWGVKSMTECAFLTVRGEWLNYYGAHEVYIERLWFTPCEEVISIQPQN